MKTKFGRIFMFCGVILILGALGLLVYNKYEEKRAGDEANAIAQAVMSRISAETGGEKNGIAELDTVEVDGRQYVGLLEVPSLELSLPVMNEWSYPNLKISPCMYSLDVEKNSMVMAAHNYTSHFGNLSLLTGGESVTFTDVNGNRYYYEVHEVVITEPTDIEGMLDDKWDLTLFTCTYGGAARVTVRCMMKDNIVK